MVELKRVLCPIDLSELSARALAYANMIVIWYGGHLTVLHVAPTFDPLEVQGPALFDPVRFVTPPSREEALELVRQALTTAGIPTQNVTVAAEAGDTETTIVDQALTMGADLIVMATHGRRGFDRLLLGSVTEKVLRKAPCPVLTVPPRAPGSPVEIPLEQVLCPIDFSAGSLQALGFALDIARRAHASVTVLHAVEWLADEEPREFAHFSVPEYRQYLMEDARDRLDAVLQDEPPIERGTKTRVVAGRAYREILRAAGEESADLIVMGAQGRGGPPITQLGSTTQHVVRGASCPVLTVRGAGGTE
jgi:nucleotide-binding universal stress UspA family protein